MKQIKRGDIIYVDLGQHPKSSVQSGVRPCVVVTIDRRKVISKVGHIEEESEVMKNINEAMQLQLGLNM